MGVSDDALAGEQVLVDRNGWLRAHWRPVGLPGNPGDWTNPQVLSVVVDDIETHPIAVAAITGHVHHN
jgi:hypothetical protein